MSGESLATSRKSSATCRPEGSHTRMSLVRLPIEADFFLWEIVTERELRRTALLV